MMKNFTKRTLLTTFIAFVLIALYAVDLNAQVVIPFTPRESSQAPAPYKNQTNYHLQGDFTMIGNTNLTLKNYTNNGNNSGDMIYVDVDDDITTVNSSSSTLIIPDESCTEIVYAGLYWTGRAHDGDSSPSVFPVETDEFETRYNINRNVTQRVGERVGEYVLSTTTTLSSVGRYPEYNLNAPAHLTNVQFRLTNNNNLNNRLQYSINNTDWINITLSSYTTSGNQGIAILGSPLVINQGSHTITVTEIGRDSRSNRQSDFNDPDRNYIKYNISGDINEVVYNTLDKQKVKLKKAGNTYQEVIDGNIDILYPSGKYSNMYAAYADVTDYVRANGSGEYFVADIALREGNGGGTGYYGGWGMVVIYQNPAMKWRDITVFDGYGFMNSSAGSADLTVSGFQAAQHGEVQVRLGMMAGEGDRNISGDYFSMQQPNTGNYTNLNHGGNSATNFFNSSIFTGGNPRNPNLTNNTGMDISMFELNNTNNQLIVNGQTSTTFRYGSDQDAYNIFNITFAVDAYTTEVIGENTPVQVGGVTPFPGGTIDPSQELEFLLDIYNTGEEAIHSTLVEIPVPYNLHFVSAIPTSGFPVTGNATWSHPSGATDPSITPGGLITWDIGELPDDPTRAKIMAQLRYRFKVTDDCTLLTTSVGSCCLEIAINGTITGTGAVSGLPLNTGLVRDNSQGGCIGYNHNDFTSTIEIGSEFISNCHAVEDGIKQIIVYCEMSGSVDRSVVVNEYPIGTKFFDTPPASYATTTGEVTGDFAIATTSEVKTTYYAISPGMPPNCYMILEINNTKVDSVPIVADVSFCEGEEVILDVALSPEGASHGHHLIYYDSNDIILSNPPAPTTIGVHTYKVAEGVLVNGIPCIGNTVSFTIEITEVPVLTTNLPDLSICENSDIVLEVTQDIGATYTWEYKTDTSATVWQPLTNASFSNVLRITNTTINLLHTTPAVDGIVVSLKVDEGACKILSYEFRIEMRNCKAIINPVLAN